MPLENIQKGVLDSSDFADIELADIIDVSALQEMMDDYYALTGFAFAILDIKGVVLVSGGWQDICVKFHRAVPESFAFCLESDTSLSSGVPPGTFKEYRCKNSMWDIATPIMLGHRHIGNIFMGQFLYDDEKPDYELFRAQARRFGYDEAEYLAALDRVPRYSRETVKSGMSFCSKLAQMISRSNYNNVMLADTLARREQAEAALRESEEKFAKIFSSAPSLLAITTIAEGRLIDVNEAFERFTGYSREEAIGRTSLELNVWPAETLSRFLEAIHTEGRVRDLEADFLHKNGEHLVGLVSMEVIEIKGEKRLLSLVKDITARKRAEEKLRLSEQKYAGFFQLIPDMVGITHMADGRFIEVNQGFEILTGWDKSDVIDRSSLDLGLWGAEVRARAIEIIREQGHLENYEFILTTRSGGQRNALMYLKPTKVTGEECLFFIARDITELKQAEAALRLAKDAAEAATQAKSQFLANMSHELRTPMTGVLGMLDLALSGNLEAEQREFIELAQTSARSLVRILNDILDLTKIEMGKLSLEESPFSIRQCLQTTHNILLPVAKTKGLDLDFTVADDVPELLLGDQTRLNQVLTNLAGNAVKFTQKGQVAIRVAASGVTPGGRREFTFTVADTGIGIPNDKQHLLFQVFSQVNGSHSRNYGGSGLGLAISKELVERMGGAISSTSEEGKGSIFSFTIQFAEAEKKRTANVTAGEKASAGDAPRDAEITKPRLLVAEDEPTIRQLLGLMLQRSNFEIDFAEDGEQVVEMWDRGHYDLILMDVQMPRMDGFEATAAIRVKELNRGGHTPIVAMTAHAFKEDEERCLVAGMDAYISKPIDFKKSLQVIAGIIRQKPEIL